MAKHYDKGVCLHCGGNVGDDGMSAIDETSPGAGPVNPQESDDDSPQLELNKRMRRQALADALKGGK